MAPVARELSTDAGVLEPLQGAVSIDGQIEELRTVLEGNAALPAIVIGHSWGALLSMMLAAKHPTLVKKLILVSTPPLDASDARGIMDARLGRMTKAERARAKELFMQLERGGDEERDACFAELGRMSVKCDSYDPDPVKDEILEYQHNTFQSVWSQAEILRTKGEFLNIAGRIACPVVALHGDHDPHPAAAVRRHLSHRIQQFEFFLLSHCGHYPWIERQAREKFYQLLRREASC
jgi:pimeloyl-ACP methyl ester carboxylesterase